MSTPTNNTPKKNSARSRHNARTHGLTATLPHSEEEAAELQAAADLWRLDLGPQGEAEEALVLQAARASVRLKRAEEIENANIRQAASDAVKLWEKKRRHSIRKLAQGLKSDPVNILSDLESSTFGCEWMIKQWFRLQAAAAQGQPWPYVDFTQAMALLGFLPHSPGPDASEESRLFYNLALIAAGSRPENPKGVPTDRLQALAKLREMIQDEIDRLQELRLEVWETTDRFEADAIAISGKLDHSKEGQLVKRYRKEAFSEMTRSMNLLLRVRGERGRPEPRRADPAPVPEPSVSKGEQILAILRNEMVKEGLEPPKDYPNCNMSNEMREAAPGQPAPAPKRTEPDFRAPGGVPKEPEVYPWTIVKPSEGADRGSSGDSRSV